MKQNRKILLYFTNMFLYLSMSASKSVSLKYPRLKHLRVKYND